MAAPDAFAHEPGSDRLVSTFTTCGRQRVAGVGERWRMPVSSWFAASGLDDSNEIAAMPHDCIAVGVSGRIECVKGGRPGRAAPAAADLFTLELLGDPVLYVSDPDTRFIHLNFEPSLWKDVARDLAGERAEWTELRRDRVFHADPELRGQLDAYIARAFSPDQPCAIEMDSRANLIALTLLKSHSTLELGRPAVPMALTPLRLNRFRDYVEAHLDQNLTLADLSAAVGLSAFHFARAFKRQTGVPPHRYLMERRVVRARVLLASGDAPLAEVAIACGFAGQSHFTTAFKRHAGLTPGAWRKAVRH